MSNSGKTFGKIDWYRAVFHNYTIEEILRKLYLDVFLDDFYKNYTVRVLGYNKQFNFCYEGVSLQSSYPCIMQTAFSIQDGVDTVFSTRFAQIRLDISSTGLDFIRSTFNSKGQPLLENFLRDIHSFEIDDGTSRDYRVTRCCFAFDLIDYKPEFLSKVVQHLEMITDTTDYKRVPLLSSSGGVQFSIKRNPHECIVCLGAPHSGQMLRIYDKRLEALTDGVPNERVPDIPEYRNCSSWIRLELQTRSKKAHSVCYGLADFSSIFRYIYDTYAFIPPHTKNATKDSICDFWRELFDWGNSPKLYRIEKHTK